MERESTETGREPESLEEKLPSESERLFPLAGRRRWRQIFYRSGLATLVLGAGISAASLLHRESRANAEVLSHNGNCEVAVQVVGVRFINRVGDPDVLDQGDQIVGRAGNFTASVQTSAGETLRTVFVGSDGVANTPKFVRRCDTTGVNGQPAVSLQLRTDQSGRVLPFTVEDHNARRVFVGGEVEGGVVSVPTPVLPVATPTREPESPPPPVDEDFWRRWGVPLLIAAAILVGAAAIVTVLRRREEEDHDHPPYGPHHHGPGPHHHEPAGPAPVTPPGPVQPPQPQPVQPPPGGVVPPVAGHEHQAVQQEIGALRRDLTAHGHRIQNIEGVLGHRPPPREPQVQAVVQEPVVQPAPEQPQARAEVQVQPQAPVVLEARREQPSPRRNGARVTGRERLRRAKRVDTWIDPELAEQLATIEAAESREQPRVHVDVEGHREPGRGV